MPARRKRVSSKKKKKSLLSFLLVLVVSLAIGLPIAYKLSASHSSGNVQGISSASGSGELRGPNPSITPKATIQTLSFSAGNCSAYMMAKPGALFFGSATYTCSDGTTGSVTPPGNAKCTNISELAMKAVKLCAGFGKASDTTKTDLKPSVSPESNKPFNLNPFRR